MILVQTAFRIPVSIVSQVDVWLGELNAPPMMMDLSRSDLIRELILWALPQKPMINEQSVTQNVAADQIQVAVRMPQDLLKQVDQYLSEINKDRKIYKFTRADFVRYVLSWSLIERPEWEAGKPLPARDRSIETSIFGFEHMASPSTKKRQYFGVVLKVPLGIYPAGARFDFAIIDFTTSVLELYRKRCDEEPRCIARLRLAVSLVLKESA